MAAVSRTAESVEGDSFGRIEGYDWTRYSSENEIEAQDWAASKEEMTAIVAAFRGE